MNEHETRQEARLLGFDEEQIGRMVDAARSNKLPTGRTATCLHCQGFGLTLAGEECKGCGGHCFVRPEVQAQQRRDLEVARLLDSVTVRPEPSPWLSQEAVSLLCFGASGAAVLVGLIGHSCGLW